MHQTTKTNQWHFGMKAHIGVDAESGFVQREPGVKAMHWLPLVFGLSMVAVGGIVAAAS